MSANDLRLIRPDRRLHREMIGDLTGKTFAHHGLGYWGWQEYLRREYLDPGHYDWSASTIGLLDGRVVTHWGVWGPTWRAPATTREPSPSTGRSCAWTRNTSRRWCGCVWWRRMRAARAIR